MICHVAVRNNLQGNRLLSVWSVFVWVTARFIYCTEWTTMTAPPFFLSFYPLYSALLWINFLKDTFSFCKMKSAFKIPLSDNSFTVTTFHMSKYSLLFKVMLGKLSDCISQGRHFYLSQTHTWMAALENLWHQNSFLLSATVLCEKSYFPPLLLEPDIIEVDLENSQPLMENKSRKNNILTALAAVKHACVQWHVSMYVTDRMNWTTGHFHGLHSNLLAHWSGSVMVVIFFILFF